MKYQTCFFFFFFFFFFFCVCVCGGGGGGGGGSGNKKIIISICRLPKILPKVRSITSKLLELASDCGPNPS